MQSSPISNYNRYLRFLEVECHLSFTDYAQLHQWSIDHPSEFWESVATFFGVTFDQSFDKAVIPARPFWKTQWFPKAQLSYASHVFRHYNDDRPALIYQSENHPYIEISWAALLSKVVAFQKLLSQRGVSKGDRVVALCANTPEAVAAFLATNSLGAIWSSCSPDFGIEAVYDRFAPLAPKVIWAQMDYHYNGKSYDIKEKVRLLASRLPQPTQLLYFEDHAGFTESSTNVADLHIEPVEFSHPIWVLFSSGTTGKPKAITHSTGGMILEHLKALAIHQDLQVGERYFWYSTTGWMMWNYALSSLLCGATLCLYNGAPHFPDPAVLWRFAQQANINHFGHGAVFYQNQIEQQKEVVNGSHLHSLRTIGATGSPLSVSVCKALQKRFPNTQVISLSGGTDVCTAFVGGHPEMEVIPGEIQCKMLGASVAVWDDQGNAQVGRAGELVLTAPFISMPVCLWGDDQFKRYQKSYFSKYKNVWHHGDWATETERGGIIIHGRSDATLNRYGVRIGTSELYNALASIKNIDDSLVIHLTNDNAEQLILFVKTQETLDVDHIKKQIRSHCSPRHVPDLIVQSPDIPYTISGKKVEVPIKRILLGENHEEVLSVESLRNSESIGWFSDYAKTLKF
jgi:acetoacetyl-CoA synthetase